MAIARTAVQTSDKFTGTATNTFTTASITPTAGGVLVLDLVIPGDIGVANVSAASAGATWTRDANASRQSSTWVCGVRLYGVGGNAAGAVTISLGGGKTATNVCWSLYEYTGVNTTTPNVAANSANGYVTGSATASANYPVTMTSGDVLLAAFASRGAGTTGTKRGANWNEIHDVGAGSVSALETQDTAVADTAGSVTWTASTNTIVMLSELANASPTPITVALPTVDVIFDAGSTPLGTGQVLDPIDITFEPLDLTVDVAASSSPSFHTAFRRRTRCW